MTDAELLRKIGNACAVIGRDSAGRVVMQLALDEAYAAKLIALGKDAIERSDGDDELFREPPVSVGWLESA
jgi:hypothetical protein